MRKIIGFIQILMLGIVFQVQSQNFECGSDKIHNRLMEIDSVYLKQNKILESKIKDLIETQTDNRQPNIIYTIPVVFHVIHLGEENGVGTNVSDQIIIDALNNLNDRWRNTNGLGVDMEIQFCLAGRNPSGGPTNGINRINAASIPNYASNGINMIYSNCGGASEATIKGLSSWPINQYYNIWIVKSICNGALGGVAYHPTTDPLDGTVISYDNIYNTNFGTLSHEIGHAFDLYHTFEGDGGNAVCPPSSPCNSTGDYVCDTPPTKRYDCSPTTACTASGIWSNSLNNYMGYCANVLRDRFTLGQKNRVRAAAGVFPRSSLLTSLACTNLATATFQNTEYKIFPNPLEDKLTIQIDKPFSKASIEIYTILGGIILKQQILESVTEIDFSGFSKGIYFIKINTDNDVVIKKMIKK